MKFPLRYYTSKGLPVLLSWPVLLLLIAKLVKVSTASHPTFHVYQSSSPTSSPTSSFYSTTNSGHIEVLSSSDSLPFIFSSMVQSDASSAKLNPLDTLASEVNTKDNSSGDDGIPMPSTFLVTEIETLSPSESHFELMKSSSTEISGGDYSTELFPSDQVTQSSLTTSHLRSVHIDEEMLSKSSDVRSMILVLTTPTPPQGLSASQISAVNLEKQMTRLAEGTQQVSFPQQDYELNNVSESNAYVVLQETTSSQSPPVPKDSDVGDIVVGRRCSADQKDMVWWNDTDGGMLALKSCPSGYQGNAYRPCYTSGKWGRVDYSECRLEDLGRMRQLVSSNIHKGLMRGLHHLAEELAQYLSSVDMRSPMDRLEALEILNTLLKVNINLRLDKHGDVNYVQALLQSSDQLLTRKNVFFSPESEKNNLITTKAAELVFDLTAFAKRALRGLLSTKKKQIAFRSARNVVMYLYRGKLSSNTLQSKGNSSWEYLHEGEPVSAFNLEQTLEKSAYALMWIRGFGDLFSNSELVVNSDIAVATILPPPDSLSRLKHWPTFDIGLRMKKESIEDFYKQECGLLWNTTVLWNTDDCFIVTRRANIVTCRCRHLGSIALLLKRNDDHQKYSPSTAHVGKIIILSCVASLVAVMLTFVINIFHYRREPPHSSLILLNLLISMATTQIVFMAGINATTHHELCYSVALILHYLFLVTCFWLVSYSIHLLRKLRNAARYTGRVRDYCIFSWVLPVTLVIVSFVVNPRGYEMKKYCWLTIQRGMLLSFIVPVTGLILVNTIVMVLVLKTFNEQISVTHKTEICKIRTSMRAGVTLLPFFSVNWFFGVLAVEDSSTAAFQLAFALTNTLLGVLIFIFFCAMDSEIRQSFRMRFTKNTRKQKISAMKLKKSCSFPVRERTLASLSDDVRRLDSQPLLSASLAYSPMSEDPCCSNIRV